MSQQQKEDSVLFSLRSLMTIEDERVRQEDEAQRRAELAARQEVEATRQRELEARAQQARVADEARVAEARARREAEARAERERDEAALRLRLESESRLRERELGLRMEHEQKLALIASQRRSGVHPAAAAAGVFALLGALGLGAFFGVVRPQREASVAETLRAEQGRRDADERRVVAERAADEARARAAEAEAGRQRQAATLLATQESAARAARPVTVASRPRTNHATPRPRATGEPEIIGALDDELPGGN
jgi:colicin import membrane protein